MNRTVLAIGECMVELSSAQGGLYAMGFAGDTFNTAWYLRRRLPPYWRVGYLSAVGTDTVSGRMLDFIVASGIDVSHVVRIPDRTVGLYMIELDRGERSFVYWRGEAAARRLAQDAARLGAALDGVAAVYLSGITLGILAEPDRARLLAALRASGALVIFDTNLRPRLFETLDAMRDAVTEAASIADIVLPSFDDEAAYFGDADPSATAARYADLGAALVVVKDGAGPVHTRQAGTASRFETEPAARIVDTTAAGDSFNAGFLARHLQGAALGEAVAAGAALARQVIAHRGALVEVD